MAGGTVTIRAILDAGAFSRSLDDMRRRLKALEGGNFDKVEQSAGKAAASVGKTASEAQRAASRLKEVGGDGLDGAARAADRAAASVDGVADAAEGAGGSLGDVGDADGRLDWDGLEDGVGAAERLDGGFTVLKGTLANLAADGIARLASGMRDIAGDALEIGKGFESSMSNVAALSGAGADELEDLEGKAREMGATTTFSASQAADALGYMALAGWETQEMLDGVGGALTLAQAGQMDLAASSDLITDYLSAFGMQADETNRMVDVLAYSQANANTTVEGLGMAFKNCAANAHAAGLDVETTSAAISMMANQGLKGSEAGTAMNAMLRDMTDKMKDGAVQIGENSVQVVDAQGNYRDLAAILADVEAATNGLGDADKAAALQATFTADSIKGMNLLLNAGSEELAGFRDRLYGCAGAGQALASTMTDNLDGDLAEMNSALEETALKVYDEVREPLRDLVQFVTSDMVPCIDWMVENFDEVGPAVGAVSAAIAVMVAKGKLVKSDAYQALVRELLRTEGASAGAAAAATGNAAAQKAAATAAKANAGAVKASTVAMNAGKMAATGLGAAVKTIGPVAAMALLIEAVTSIAGSFSQAASDAETLERATDGLSESINSIGAEGMGAAAEEYRAGADEIIEASREAIAAQADLADSVGDVFSDIASDNALVDGYTGTIERLAGKSNLSAKEQGELAAAVSGLNSVCGTTYEVMDAVNGTLSASTAEVLANADAWKKNAEVMALQEVYEEAVKNRIKQEEELARATEAANNAERDFEFTLFGTRVLEGFATAEANELADQRDAQAEATDEAKRAEENLKARLEEAAAAQQQAAEAAQEQAQAAEESAAAMETQGASAGMTRQEMEALAEQNAKIVEDIQGAAEKSELFASALADSGMSAEELAAKLQDTGISADELASSIESCVDKTANAFDEIEMKSDVSLDSMIDTLAKNREATEQWTENVTQLYARAGSDSERAFVEYISGLGVEYAPIVDDLVNTSSEKFSQLAEEWRKGVEAGKDGALASTGLLSEGVGEEVQRAVEQVRASSSEVGDAIGQGMSEGAANSAGQVTSAVGDMSQGAIDSARSTLGVHSPSTVFAEIGANLDQGLAQGISQSEGLVSAAMATAMGNAVAKASEVSATGAAAMAKGLADSVSNAAKSAEAGVSGMSAAMSKGMAEIVANMKTIDQGKSAMETAFDAVVSKAQSSMGSATDAVRNAVGAMRSAMNFSWSLPHLKVPHVSISGKFNLDPPSAPDFKVNWYATGGIFDRASIIGVGEAGREAVVPLTRPSLAPFAEAVAAEMGGGGTTVVNNYYIDGIQVDAESAMGRAVADVARALRMEQRSNARRGYGR
ncbi:phage tail tape measure protein [Eggerthellaceae bacterium 24-137]